MKLYHASKEIVQYPGIRKEKYTKDFSWGFYCTDNIQQALSALNSLIFAKSTAVYNKNIPVGAENGVLEKF